MNKQHITYSDIYEPKFLEQFGEHKNKIKSLKLTHEYEIDIKKIAEICRISISPSKNKFDMAHEISHIILGHKANNPKYKETVAKLNNIAADKFAKELLLPKKLVKMAIIKSINDLGYTRNQIFSNCEFDTIIAETAITLNTPKQLLKLRIKQLNLFKNNKDV